MSNEFKIFEVLRYGKGNAIPSRLLAKTLHFRSVRDLQKAVEQERRNGAPILCDSHGAGYYLSNNPVELRRFSHTLHARAENTLRAAESIDLVLHRAENFEKEE